MHSKIDVVTVKFFVTGEDFRDQDELARVLQKGLETQGYEIVTMGKHQSNAALKLPLVEKEFTATIHRKDHTLITSDPIKVFVNDVGRATDIRELEAVFAAYNLIDENKRFEAAGLGKTGTEVKEMLWNFRVDKLIKKYKQGGETKVTKKETKKLKDKKQELQQATPVIPPQTDIVDNPATKHEIVLTNLLSKIKREKELAELYPIAPTKPLPQAPNPTKPKGFQFPDSYLVRETKRAKARYQTIMSSLKD